MTGTDEFFLTEVFEEEQVRVDTPPRERPVVPDRVRLRPIDAGFVLTWREIPDAGRAYRRRGMVVALAPRMRSVWVQPDDPREGEGLAVVVDNVTAEKWAGAERRLGVPADLLSTAAWQMPPQDLPRATLRQDRISYHDGPVSVHPPALHAAPGCPAPARVAQMFGATMFEAGPDLQVEGCYVVSGYLHPLSVRPTYPNPFSDRTGSLPVPVCRCLKDDRPA